VGTLVGLRFWGVNPAHADVIGGGQGDEAVETQVFGPVLCLAQQGHSLPGISCQHPSQVCRGTDEVTIMTTHASHVLTGPPQ
jgi:hypothetical protein